MKEKTTEDLIMSKMDHVKLKDLKQMIGHDYSKQLQKHIKQKTGKEYTTPHIRRSLSMANLNPRFVIWAVELGNKLEELRKQEQIKEQSTINAVEDFLAN